MSKTLKEIARLVNGDIVGDENALITGVAGIEDAREGDITFMANPKYHAFLSRTRASCVIVGRDAADAGGKTLLRVDNPSLAFTQVVSFVHPQEIRHPAGVHASAVVAPGAVIGRNAGIGACAVVGEGARIGDNTVIYPNCSIGRNAVIGGNTIVYSNVSIREDVKVGNNVIVHAGTVIGSDGFGFVTVNGVHHKIPQVGTVVIEDDVEIGANCTIDRARFDKTVIGQGTKLDNMVHIAHNVTIGRNCLIVAQVGVSGSTTIGNNVILAGQVGVVGHVTIGDNAIVMAKSGISKNVPENSVLYGVPAQPVNEAKKLHAYVNGLPKMHQTLKELKERIDKLEKKQ
ncbi:MAG TPA: UDP-3-O-(3-hydroxymyristoyl)glucosamine N-acyltransferase [Candidatus Omnitrophota bacterium]|nr:UDP-3-O-(3-hydroxymyristoyl)glucosamine N-acyltransferase [Candidatus Omnitrophota bacterium]HQO38233.1 UDP-3-O-(3-hydroxymyristoyl)glucosamine N-acyltransferase [Candidatus Omnitrophota bacterium]HQQ06246.1 UDP-3-O-(3-hydroxymyristoyl)glucosamine N-acyltransferase [Candidatus Omnitrophota bacterium]